MSQVLHPGLVDAGTAGLAGAPIAAATPVVQRPAHYAPAGVPIALASGLRYDQLLNYVAQQPSLAILEIGVARGANTLRMMAFADWLGGKPHYTGIDLFDQLTDEQFERSYCSAAKRPISINATMQQFRSLLGDAIAQRIELLQGYSHDVLPDLILNGRKYDLIFIDGGHSLDDVNRDWNHAQQLLAPGGTIVFDDYPNWGVGPTVHTIELTKWNVRILPHRDTFQNHRTDEDPSPLRHHQLVEARRR